MADLQHLDDEAVVVHVVDDPVVTSANPIGRHFTDELGATRWTWIVGKELDDRPDTLLVPSRKAGEDFGSSAGDLDLVTPCHASPRSALTSSQGT